MTEAHCDRQTGHTDWKRLIALPMLVIGLGVGVYTVGRGFPSTLPPGQTRWWTAFSLFFVFAQVIYCRRFRVGFDWFDSRWRALRNAWIVLTLVFAFSWFVRLRWLPANPAGLAEYVVGGACFSGVWLAVAALSGIDLDQE